MNTMMTAWLAIEYPPTPALLTANPPVPTVEKVIVTASYIGIPVIIRQMISKRVIAIYIW